MATDTAGAAGRRLLEELVAGATDRVEVRTVRRASPEPGSSGWSSTASRTSSRCSRPTTTGSCGSPATRRTGSSRSGRPGSTPSARRSSTTPSSAWPSRATARRPALDPDDRLRRRPRARRATTPSRRHTTPTSSTTWRRCTRTFMGWHDDLGLQDLARRCLLLRPRHDRARARGRRRARPDRGRPPGLGGCSPSGRRASHELVRDVHRDPDALGDALGPRRSRSWPATGSSATSAAAPTAEPCCSTGPTRARRRRAGT